MIRSMTIGLPLTEMSISEIDARVKVLHSKAAEILGPKGLLPRTIRYTLPSVGLEGESDGVILSQMRWVDELARKTGVRWFCLPVDFMPDLPRRGRITAALDSLVRFDRMFLNIIIASKRQIAANAAFDAAQLILDLSRKTNNGFDNFRVGVSCNCPANAPFFPFSRHEGSNIAFSFALETTHPALEAIERCDSPHDVGAMRDTIVDALTRRVSQIDSLGQELALKTGTEYRGLDASFAPLPSESVSVAALIEKITGSAIGGHGSIFATAFLTDAVRTAIQKSKATACGFNGVMFSVLEDTVLASANNRRCINLDTLLSLSTVCACGLDMIPIPGISFPEEVAAVMLDVAAISCAHNKPLGVRLLPIPNGKVNDLTKFNLDFLCDSRVIGLTDNDKQLRTKEHVVGYRYPVNPVQSDG